MIYFDNAATSGTKPKEVIEAVDKRWAEYGIGEFITSPSLKYRKLLFNEKAEW